jgi:putative phage tail component, N-terminal domain protein
MYIFNDTTKGTPTFNSGLEVQFGGVSLNQEMNNEDGTFFVANTTGRDVLDFRHETATIKGRDGQYLYGATYKEREIEIQVRLTGNTDLGMRKQYERLNRLLFSRKAKKLVFGDDSGRYYKAIFSKVKKPELEDANDTVIKLHFICYDPFKCTEPKTVTTSTVDYQGDFPTEPILKLTTEAGSEIRILHLETQKYIRLKATYIQGSNLLVNCETREIKLNDRNELMNFDMVNSRYFKLQKGVNTFQVEGATLNSIEYKEVFA